jgi:amino acid transporter
MRAIGWDEPASIALLALFGLGGVLLLVFTGLAVLVARRPSLRRRLKILVAAVAGGVCGTLWVLFVATILDAARPGTLMDLPLVALGVVVAVSAAVLFSGSGRSACTALGGRVQCPYTVARAWRGGRVNF